MSFGLSNYGELPCLCNNPQHVRRDARPFFGSVLSHVECLEPCAEDSTSSSQARLENSLLSRGASGRELHNCRGLSFVFAWLYAGGNPHGMGTPPGISQVLRWVFWSAFLGTIGLTLLAKGRGRFFIVAAIVSAVLADLAAMLSDFD